MQIVCLLTEKKYLIAVIASRRTVAGILWQYDAWQWHTDSDTYTLIDLLIIWADSHQETDDDLLFSSLKLL